MLVHVHVIHVRYIYIYIYNIYIYIYTYTRLCVWSMDVETPCPEELGKFARNLFWPQVRQKLNEVGMPVHHLALCTRLSNHECRRGVSPSDDMGTMPWQYSQSSKSTGNAKIKLRHSTRNQNNANVYTAFLVYAKPSARVASWLLRVYVCCVQRTRLSRVAFNVLFSFTCRSCLVRAQAVVHASSLQF